MYSKLNCVAKKYLLELKKTFISIWQQYQNKSVLINKMM